MNGDVGPLVQYRSRAQEHISFCNIKTRVQLTINTAGWGK